MSCKRPTFDFSKSAFQPASDRHPQASRRVFDRYLLLVAGQTIFVNEGVARGTWWSQGPPKTEEISVFGNRLGKCLPRCPQTALQVGAKSCPSNFTLDACSACINYVRWISRHRSLALPGVRRQPRQYQAGSVARNQVSGARKSTFAIVNAVDPRVGTQSGKVSGRALAALAQNF
jgi:hypothetical protein